MAASVARGSVQYGGDTAWRIPVGGPLPSRLTVGNNVRVAIRFVSGSGFSTSPVVLKYLETVLGETSTTALTPAFDKTNDEVGVSIAPSCTIPQAPKGVPESTLALKLHRPPVRCLQLSVSKPHSTHVNEAPSVNWSSQFRESERASQATDRKAESALS